MEGIKVLYDYQAFAMQAYGGVSRSFVELIAHLPADVQYQIAVRRTNNEHLWDANLAPQGAHRCPFPFKSLKRYSWGNKLGKLHNHLLERLPGQRYSARVVEQGNYDVFHPTFFNPYFLKHLGDKPFVLTVHDLTYEVLNDGRQPRRDHQVQHRQLLCPRAAHIVAVSENTARDVMRFYNVPRERITVIHHGSPERHDRESLEPVCDFPYILYVGSRNYYKNFTSMLQALAPYLRDGDCRMVCTGPAWNAAERALIAQLGLEQRVVHYHATSDELYRLFNHAQLFVYPSRYEGFGIPILEAFANGCPVLLSRASCFPEIGGDAARYFDLDDDASLLSQVQTIVDDAALRQSMTACGYDRLQQFSWQTSAARLAAVYRQVCGKC